MSEAGWREARKTRVRADRQSAAISLLPDELVEYQARRSWKYLLLNEALLLFALIFVPLVAYLLLRAQVTAATANAGNVAAWTTVSIIVPAVLVAIFGLVMGFRYLDWLNDYFVITNKHLAHREFDLVRFHINIKKLPVHQIQSVGIAKPNFWANLLNIGTARITTASRFGTILFDNIDNPLQVKDVYERLNKRGRNLDEAREQMSMRETIEGHFSVEPAYRPVEGQNDDLPEPEMIVPGFWRRFWQRYQSRVEDQGVVTYRKHVFVLLKESVWPIGLGILVSVIIYLLANFSAINTTQLLIVWSVFLGADFLWFLWRVEDWRNDTFQVTDKFVIDIDRKPFGFGESRKQAGIDNVQNVNADRPGLLPTIFNYGDVIVETAGANADIVFEDVANPSEVQSDIFRRLDRARQQKRLNASKERRKEYSVLVDVYRQAMEQERIPRRTPDAADLELEGE
ncbi:MAG: PH domain-containing protein [Chloroflexota bacterium]